MRQAKLPPLRNPVNTNGFRDNDLIREYASIVTARASPVLVPMHCVFASDGNTILGAQLKRWRFIGQYSELGAALVCANLRGAGCNAFAFPFNLHGQRQLSRAIEQTLIDLNRE